MKKKISIIIPAYKVDVYIEKCIRSLENQDLPKEDYEIIVTNDGSPDRCKEIVESLQMEFSNIVLINQENQGVSMARNNAIAVAKGKYILPIDPDDYIVPNVLQMVYQVAVTRNLDVLYLPYEIFDVNGKAIWETNYSDLQDQTFNGVDGYFAIRNSATKDPDRSWAMLYRLDLLKKHTVVYPKNVPYLEDGLFLAKIFAVADKVGFTNQKFYQRTTRPGSATNSRLFFSEKAIKGFILAAKELKKFASNLNLNSKQQGLVNHVIIKFVLLALIPLASIKSFKGFSKVTAELKKGEFSKLDVAGVSDRVYCKFATSYNRSGYYFLAVYLKFKFSQKFKLK